MRLILAWWHILTGIGSALKAGRQTDQLFRYYVLTALDQIEFFVFLSKPRAYGDILTKFELEDNDYTKDVLNILVSDSENVLSINSDLYVHNPSAERKGLDEILSTTGQVVQPMVKVAEVLSENILERMRAEKIDVEEIFTRDEHRVTKMFHDVLGTSFYTVVRNAVFAYLPRAEKRWLKGRELLEIGCGSGRETAELWVHLDGETAITGIDPVPRMVQLAENSFENYLGEISSNYLPIVDSAHPVFKIGNAVQLPFEDDSFDAVFWAFMMHWTSDPKKVIEEAIRVVRPGGLIFGAQQYKPYINPYLDLVVRSSRNSYGFFWKEEFLYWFKTHGLDIDIATPAGLFRARNTSDE
jgi:ubiquinone/menaquinone biosynthesis C-methylase UbiE